MKTIFSWKQVFFVHHRIASAVKRVEFVSDKVSYVVLRGRGCNVVVLKEHAPSEEKSDDSKDSFDVDRFNLRKVSELEVRNSIGLRSQTGLQLWRT